MLLPKLETGGQTRTELIAFGGLNLSESTSAGEFSKMQNTSSDKFPCICPSVKKDTVKISTQIKNIRAFTAPGDTEGEVKGFTGISDGGFYYQDKKLPFEFSFMSIPSDSEIQLIHFGDRIIIMPQMYCFNYLSTEKQCVKPLIPGVYSDWVRVKSGEAIGEAATLTLQDSLRTWEEYGFETGDSVVIKTTISKYDSINMYITDNKYEELLSEKIVKAVVVSINEDVMKLNLYDKSDNIIICRGDDGEPIDYVFKNEELRIYKRYPEFSYGCVYFNRLWAVTKSGDSIYASAPGEPGEFSRFNGLSTDSWYTELGESGVFTGIEAWNGSVVAFKKSHIYQIFGNRASNFSIGKQLCNCGCVDFRSISKIDEGIFFLGSDGVYEYSGGIPIKISEKLNLERCVSGVGFSDGKKYYITPNGEKILYAYDKSKSIWNVEGLFSIVGGVLFGNAVYFALSDKVLKLSNSYENEWLVITCDITENEMKHKGINNLFLRIENAQNSYAKISVSVNGGEFFKCGRTDEPGEYTFRVPVRFKKGDSYRIKISGKGNTVIRSMESCTYSGGKAFTRKG